MNNDIKDVPPVAGRNHTAKMGAPFAAGPWLHDIEVHTFIEDQTEVMTHTFWIVTLKPVVKGAKPKPKPRKAGPFPNVQSAVAVAATMKFGSLEAALMAALAV
jgi:hypothetical protein